MHRPTSRVLTMLELLQSRNMTGGELARRLEVDGRTVRRYVATLQDLGIPVEGERGRYGAYRLRPGHKLPPMIFGDEEVLALSLGLLAARQLGLSEVAPAVEGALAKVERVLPEALRQRLRSRERTVILSATVPPTPPSAEAVSTLADAVGERRRVRLRHRSAGDRDTDRTVDAYAVLQREGRWYLFGFRPLAAWDEALQARQGAWGGGPRRELRAFGATGRTGGGAAGGSQRSRAVGGGGSAGDRHGEAA